MPMSRRMAKFNHVVTNRTIGRTAPWMPGFGVVYHRGRKSGRDYKTPVNVFPKDGGFVVALTYGSGADWVKNVLAAGECVLVSRRQRVHLVEPELYVDTEKSWMGRPTRAILKLNDTTEFLKFNVAS